ncbi:muconolactone Delta-isomerase family protein [Cupriavidus necator]
MGPVASAKRQGSTWKQLYCVVGQYANYSILDVESNDAVHTLQSGRPFVPHMKIRATPLAKNPSVR